jgi:hypothetical protein
LWFSDLKQSKKKEGNRTLKKMDERLLKITAPQVGKGLKPTMQAGRVVYNGFKNVTEMRERVDNVKSGKALFPGPTNGDTLTIEQYDLCVRYRSAFCKSDKSGEENNLVFSTVNGAFKKGQQYHEIIESLTFGGFAQYQVVHDEKRPERRDGVAQIYGGLLTIPHTGNKRIVNGDYIIWDLPNIENPAKQVGRHTDRIPFVINPYTPEIDSINFKRLKNFILSDFSENIKDMSKETQYVQTVSLLKKCFMELQYLSVVNALQLGVVTLNPDSISNDDNPDHRAEVSARNAEMLLMEDNLAKLARFFGLLDSEEEEKETVVSLLNRDNTVNATPTKKCLSSFFMMTQDDNITRYNDAHILETTRSDVNLYKTQVNVMPNLLSAIEAFHFARKSNIIGRALSSADPGDKLDIVLGNFSA